MSSEQKHNISFVRFFFIINIYDMPCERALIFATSQPIKAPQNLQHYVHENLLSQISRIKLIVFSMFFHQLLMAAAFNDAPLL